MKSFSDTGKCDQWVWLTVLEFVNVLLGFTFVVRK